MRCDKLKVEVMIAAHLNVVPQIALAPANAIITEKKPNTVAATKIYFVVFDYINFTTNSYFFFGGG